MHGFIRKSATGNLKNIINILKNKNFTAHRGDLLDCPWLFLDGDFESVNFAPKIYNQIDKQKFTYTQIVEERSIAQITQGSQAVVII